MAKTEESPATPFSRGLPALVIALTVAIYAAALVVVNLQLRASLRAQIADRTARVLNEIALLQSAPGDGALGWLGDGETESPAGLAEVLVLDIGERLREITSRSATVLGARWFDAAGELMLPLPAELVEDSDPIPPAVLAGEPKARFRPAVKISDLFLAVPASDGRTSPAALPVLEVWIPVQTPGNRVPLGTVQLLLDGSGVAAEYRQLDATLLRRALALGLTGAAIMAGALVWAFRRLDRAHRLLARRTRDLARANTELALAARTSAVGAVAAHLMHGLKNPLAGLQSFVARLDRQPAPAGAEEIHEAVLTAQRAQQLVQETVRILREEDSSVRYELTVDELVELLSSRARPAAESREVVWRVAGTVNRTLSNREANLTLLILENLVRNAIEATPPGKAVTLRVTADEHGLHFGVEDEGPGIPPEQRPSLFTPQRSNKPGGAGIGLAISRQLAAHLGARLELESSSGVGSIFSLRFESAGGGDDPAGTA
ncbi:MAG: HAMP domain-containing histidine kinase [Verrucomicrobia bacterium]|nr:HAMP domain-containing histidine kinase [Verrucomicrobiota bacterium]